MVVRDKERTDPQLWYYRGEIFRHLRNWSEALRCLKRAIQLNPRFGEALSSLGKARMEMMKEEELLSKLPDR